MAVDVKFLILGVVPPNESFDQHDLDNMVARGLQNESNENGGRVSVSVALVPLFLIAVGGSELIEPNLLEEMVSKLSRGAAREFGERVYSFVDLSDPDGGALGIFYPPPVREARGS